MPELEGISSDCRAIAQLCDALATDALTCSNAADRGDAASARQRIEAMQRREEALHEAMQTLFDTTDHLAG